MAQSTGQKILVIESYHKEMFWAAGYRKGIIDTLENQTFVSFFEMDTKRVPRTEFSARAELAIAVLDNLQPDLVMLGDDNALDFVGKAVLERNIPLVFLGINGNLRDYFDGVVPKGVTGVLERPLLKRHLELVKEIDPDLNKVLVLFDDSNTARIYKNDPFYFDGKKHAKILGLDVEIYLTNSFEELHTKIKTAQTEHQALFVGGLNALTDADQQHVSADTVLNWIHQNSEIPLFSFWRGPAGFNKAIGGYVIDGQSMGIQAANLANKILSGASPDTLQIEWLDKGKLVLSKSGLKRWNIDIPQQLSNKAEYID